MFYSGKKLESQQTMFSRSSFLIL